ncbi:hypothetical protein JIR001_22830 [Polycladomyces abyssicola]|uniref:PRC-barrel domain-containing protein n=1 Tax=Polycladomyces abyssicola TaxID=1125966 RepID=A0A8D5ZN98_9BACL|nr:PRC-barrel domain-containing protein [Polycladomyces abyssicola]BCU82500.1 hypothetical protein JIR001_22830 [Polycladomyces abyssicola]
MRKSQDVIGLPVYHAQTGRHLGTVRDLLFDEMQRFCGLLLEDGGVFKPGRYLPSELIGAIGTDAVMADSEPIPYSSPQALQRWTGMLTGQRKLRGRPVMTEQGQALGMVEDVYFLENAGTLVGYELSDGWWSDWREGRKVLRAPCPLIWGEEILIAPAVGWQMDE